MTPSTKTQRQLIGIACGQLGIDKSTKEDMLLERYGKGHTTEISKMQADEFLKELRGKGFRFRRSRQRADAPRRQRIPRAAGGNTIALVNPDELAKIAAVAALIPWRVENGLALWMKKRLGIDKIRRADHAYKVIEGLKKMFENRMKKEHGEEWWARVYDDPQVNQYIWEHCPVRWRGDMFSARVAAGLPVGGMTLMEDQER